MINANKEIIEATRKKMIALVEKAKSFYIACDNGDVPDNDQGFHYGGNISPNEIFILLRQLEEKFPDVFLSFIIEKTLILAEELPKEKSIENPNKNKMI